MPRIFVEKCLPIPQNVCFHGAYFVACACLDKGINYTFDIINNYRQHGDNITFNTHNKQNIWQKIILRCKQIANGIDTDRFCYVDALKDKYGFANPDFDFIYKIFSKLKYHKLLSFSDIKQLWNNYYFIRTKKTHKGFLIFLISLYFRKPIQ